MVGTLPLNSSTFSYYVVNAVVKNQTQLVSKNSFNVVKSLDKCKSLVVLLLIGMEDTEIAFNIPKQSLFY